MAHQHDHSMCKNSAVSAVESLCAESGLRFTELRKNVLQLIWKGHRSVKAYDIIRQMSSKGNDVKPAIVYRTLDFLLDNGFIHKIESSSSYIGCSHPSALHGCQFMICTSCGDVDEMCDNSIAEKIQNKAKRKGFRIQKQTLEITGTCSTCLHEHQQNSCLKTRQH